MREEKYKNILKETEENTEEKLSMTRELKFKEIQESIDEIDIEDELDIIRDEEETIKKENNKKIKKVQKETEEDDIYLTTTFKPVSLGKKIGRKLFKMIFSVILLSVIILALYYYVGIPLYNKYQNSKPDIIFKNTLKYITKWSNTNIKYNNDSIYSLLNEVSFKVNTNSIKYIGIEDYDFKLKFGYEEEKEFYEILAEKNDNNYSITKLKDKNYLYLNYTPNTNYLKRKIKDTDIDIPHISNNDINTIIEEVSNSFIDTFDKKYISSVPGKVTINNNEYKVTENIYYIDNDNIQSFRNKIISKLDDNPKTIPLIKELFGYDLYKDNTKELKITIYTTNGNKVVGFDIERNGFAFVYYYNIDGNMEAYINLSKASISLKLNGTKIDNKENIKITYNNIERGNIIINEQSDKKTSILYNVIYKKKNYNGYLEIEKDNNIKNKISLKIENNNKDYFIIEGNKNSVFNKTLYNIKDYKITDYTPELENNQKYKFNEEIEEELYNLINLISK